METRRVPDIDHYAMIDFFGRSEFNDGVEETRYLAFKERLMRELVSVDTVQTALARESVTSNSSTTPPPTAREGEVSKTAHQPCEYDQYCTITAKIGDAPPVLHSVVHPRGDERARLCRNMNKWIAGETPCQCDKCRTVYEARHPSIFQATR